jgi:hypothetical protein
MISEAMIELYWRQRFHLPTHPLGRPKVLRQNPGRQSRISSRLSRAREHHGLLSLAAETDATSWQCCCFTC